MPSFVGMPDGTAGYLILRMDEFGDTQAAAAFVVTFDPDSLRIRKIKLHYNPAHPDRLSPTHPEASDTFDFQSDGRHFPGVIDDCLPDDWGRRIIAATLGKSHIGWPDVLGNSWAHATIGAIKIIPIEERSAGWGESLDLSDIQCIADRVWDGQMADITASDAALKMVLQGGSRTGGARPKLLAKESRASMPNGVVEWIIKFNRSADSFNYARMEFACLALCRAAGLLVPNAEVMALPTGREGLKVERFDITSTGGRFRMATMNSLLKDPHTQDDPLYSDYESLVGVLNQYSYMPGHDVEHLFKQMLINSIVRNTDDHLRNFSLYHDSVGWRLTPVYDIVPNEEKSIEHEIACGGIKYLPALGEAVNIGVKSFGLSQEAAERAVGCVRQAAAMWPKIIKAAELNEADAEFALSLMKGRL